MSGEQSPILEGPIKLRDGKKWKNRYARITRLSPVADFLTLQLWKDLKELEKQKGPTKGSVSLSEYLGVETSFNLDKESNTIALIFRENVIIIALENRELLMKWQVRLTNQFEEGQQFNVHLVSAPKEIRHSPFGWMVVRGYRNKKSQIYFYWRYGAVDGGRFCFEGGTRCGKGEGLHVFRVDNPEDLQISFDLSSKGKLESKKRSGGIGAHLSHSPSVASSLSTVNRSVESSGSGGSGTPLITSGFGSVRSREEIKRNRSRSRSKSINASAAWSSLDNGLAINSPDTLSLAFSEHDQSTRMSSPEHLVDRRAILDRVNLSTYIPSDASSNRDLGSRSCGSESEFQLNWNMDRNNHPKRQGSVPWNGSNNSSGTWNSNNRGARSAHGTIDRVSMSSGDSQLSSNYDQPKTVLKVTTSPLPSKRGYSPSRTCSPDLHGGQRSMDTSSQRSGFRSPGSSLSSPPLTPRSLRCLSSSESPHPLFKGERGCSSARQGTLRKTANTFNLRRTMGYQDEEDMKRKLGISQGAGVCTSCSGNNSSGGYPPPSREGTPGFQNYDVPRNLGIQETSGFYDTPRSIKMKPQQQIGPMGNYDIPGEAIPVSNNPCSCPPNSNGQHQQVTVNALVHSSAEQQQQYQDHQHHNQHNHHQPQQPQPNHSQHQKLRHQSSQGSMHSPQHSQDGSSLQRSRLSQQSQDSGMGNYVNGHLNGHHQNGHNGHVQHHHQDGQNGVGSRRPGIGHLGLHGRSRSSCSSPNNVLEDMTWTCLSEDGTTPSEVSIPRVKLTGQGRMPVVDMSKINTARCFSEPPVSEKESQHLVRSMSPATGQQSQSGGGSPSSMPVYAQIDRSKKSCPGCVQKIPHRCTRQQQFNLIQQQQQQQQNTNYTNLEFAQSLSLYENSRDVLSRLAAANDAQLRSKVPESCSQTNRPNTLLPTNGRKAAGGDDNGQYLRMIPQLIRDYELMGFEDPVRNDRDGDTNGHSGPDDHNSDRVFSPDHALSPDLITTYSPPSASICSSTMDLVLSPDRASIASDRISLCSSNYGEWGDTMALMSDSRFDTIKMAPKHFGAKGENMVANLVGQIPQTTTSTPLEQSNATAINGEKVTNELSLSYQVSSSLCSGYVTIPRSRGSGGGTMEAAHSNCKSQSPTVTMRRSASVPCKQDRNSTGSGGSSSSDSGVSTGSPRQSTLDQISSFSEAIILASLNREPSPGKQIQTTEI